MGSQELRVQSQELEEYQAAVPFWLSTLDSPLSTLICMGSQELRVQSQELEEYQAAVPFWLSTLDSPLSTLITPA
jgi:hypothetical protein